MKRSLVPPVLRGSLILLRRKCGKPTCRCAKGPPHRSPALSYSQRGKTKLLTFPSALVPQVRAALQRYRQRQTHLERQATTGLRQFAARLRHRRKATR